MVVVSEQVVGAVPPQCECVLACAAYEEGVVVQRAGSWWWLDRWWGRHGQERVQQDVVCAGDEQGVTL